MAYIDLPFASINHSKAFKIIKNEKCNVSTPDVLQSPLREECRDIPKINEEIVNFCAFSLKETLCNRANYLVKDIIMRTKKAEDSIDQESIWLTPENIILVSNGKEIQDTDLITASKKMVLLAQCHKADDYTLHIEHPKIFALIRSEKKDSSAALKAEVAVQFKIIGSKITSDPEIHMTRMKAAAMNTFASVDTSLAQALSNANTHSANTDSAINYVQYMLFGGRKVHPQTYVGDALLFSRTARVHQGDPGLPCQQHYSLATSIQRKLKHIHVSVVATAMPIANLPMSLQDMQQPCLRSSIPTPQYPSIAPAVLINQITPPPFTSTVFSISDIAIKQSKVNLQKIPQALYERRRLRLVQFQGLGLGLQSRIHSHSKNQIQAKHQEKRSHSNNSE